MSFKQFLTTSAALAFAATTAFADEDQQMNEAGISVDGYIGIEYENGRYGDFYTFEDTSIIGNVLLSYKTNDWTIGIGKELDEDLENNETFSRDAYFLISNGQLTLTYGRTYDAGNLFADDFSTMSDLSTITDVARLDWELASNHHLAVSYDLDDDDKDLKFGYQGELKNIGAIPKLILVGALMFEGDDSWRSDEGAFAVTAEFDKFALQVAYHSEDPFRSDDDNPDEDYLIGLYRWVSDNMMIGGTIELDEDLNRQKDYGLFVNYNMNNGSQYRFEYTREFDTTELEIGLIIPFGKQPAAGPRQWAREFQPYFTDF